MRCAQTGCPGSYVDGYCDVCGFPQPEGAPAATFTVPTATAASTAEAEAAAAGGRPETGLPSERAAVVMPRSHGAQPTSSIALGTARGTGAIRRVEPARRGRRPGLGAGVTKVPPAPDVAPEDVVLADPQVPEEKRRCPICDAPVGRSRDGRPGRTEGYCPQCRSPYSFTPKLAPGDLVAGQYEVVGPLAHGGLGWVYLARDRNVSDRPVVLKGLLNAGDADALAAAVAEQEALARVEHPLIVEVYNVVTHDGAGYTVMEYVGGRSLKQLLQERMRAAGGVYDPLPVDQALAYVLGIVPALTYLHEVGLLYCDFKPDNLIQVGDSVKLIDLGGVRRADDLDSPIYGTVGYQAPEIAELGPSVASDVYTIGRTLVVLTTEFRGYQGVYATSLPPMRDVEVFAEHESFYRLVAKACALDPADRFGSMEEFRAQAVGVLRQVVLDRRGAGAANQSAPSEEFDVPTVFGEALTWRELPALRADETDPMLPWLQTLQVTDPQARLQALRAAPERTAEVLLEEGRTALIAGRHDHLVAVADDLLTADPWDWRAVWLLGLGALDAADLPTAHDSFETVAAQVPGELAPRLARALSHEMAARDSAAEADYLTCLRTDAGYVTAAAFGVARVRGARGDYRGAANALDLVPPTSGAAPRAQWLRAEVAAYAGGGLAAADEALALARTLTAEPRHRAAFRVQVLQQALGEVLAHGDAPTATVDGVPATRRDLRLALSGAYRALAAHSTDAAEREALVDQANEVRPWTLM